MCLKHYYVVGTSAEDVRNQIAAKIAEINANNLKALKSFISVYRRNQLFYWTDYKDFVPQQIFPTIDYAIAPQDLIVTYGAVDTAVSEQREAGNIYVGMSEDDYKDAIYDYMEANLRYLYNLTSVNDFTIHQFPTTKGSLSSVFNASQHMFKGMETTGYETVYYPTLSKSYTFHRVGVVVAGKIVSQFNSIDDPDAPKFYFYTPDGVTNTMPGTFTAHFDKKEYRFRTTPQSNMTSWTHPLPNWTAYYITPINTFTALTNQWTTGSSSYTTFTDTLYHINYTEYSSSVEARYMYKYRDICTDDYVIWATNKYAPNIIKSSYVIYDVEPD